MKVFLSVFMALLITSVTPTFDAMAAAVQKKHTTTKTNTPTAAFTNAQKQLEELKSALDAKLADLKQQEDKNNEQQAQPTPSQTPNNEIDTNQALSDKADCEKLVATKNGTECYQDTQTKKWKIRWTFKVGEDCPVKDCSVDKNVTKCKYKKVTESSFSCEITECADGYTVVDNICTKTQPQKKHECCKNVEHAIECTKSSYCEVTECETGWHVDRSRTECEQDEQEEEKCWESDTHATNGVNHGTYCEITECDPGWYPHEMRECKQEPTEMGCRSRIKNSTEVKVQYNSFGIPDCYVHKCGRGYKPSLDYKACERDDKYINVPKEYCENTLKGTYTDDDFCQCGTVYFTQDDKFKTCKLKPDSDYEYTIQ